MSQTPQMKILTDVIRPELHSHVLKTGKPLLNLSGPTARYIDKHIYQVGLRFEFRNIRFHGSIEVGLKYTFLLNYREYPLNS